MGKIFVELLGKTDFDYCKLMGTFSKPMVKPSRLTINLIPNNQSLFQSLLSLLFISFPSSLSSSPL